jgi:hypothetical protein
VDPVHRVDNAPQGKTRADSMSMETALEHFQVKWVRFTVENAPQGKTRTDSMSMETVLEQVWELDARPRHDYIYPVTSSARALNPAARRDEWLCQA